MPGAKILCKPFLGLCKYINVGLCVCVGIVYVWMFLNSHAFTFIETYASVWLCINVKKKTFFPN